MNKKDFVNKLCLDLDKINSNNFSNLSDDFFVSNTSFKTKEDFLNHSNYIELSDSDKNIFIEKYTNFKDISEFNSSVVGAKAAKITFNSMMAFSKIYNKKN